MHQSQVVGWVCQGYSGDIQQWPPPNGEVWIAGAPASAHFLGLASAGFCVCRRCQPCGGADRRRQIPELSGVERGARSMRRVAAALSRAVALRSPWGPQLGGPVFRTRAQCGHLLLGVRLVGRFGCARWVREVASACTGAPDVPSPAGELASR